MSDGEVFYSLNAQLDHEGETMVGNYRYKITEVAHPSLDPFRISQLRNSHLEQLAM